MVVDQLRFVHVAPWVSEQFFASIGGPPGGGGAGTDGGRPRPGTGEVAELLALLPSLHFGSTLPRLVARVLLIDHVVAAATPYDLARLGTLRQRSNGRYDLHRKRSWREGAGGGHALLGGGKSSRSADEGSNDDELHRDQAWSLRARGGSAMSDSQAARRASPVAPRASLGGSLKRQRVGVGRASARRTSSAR